jgi:hypothetical protein
MDHTQITAAVLTYGILTCYAILVWHVVAHVIFGRAILRPALRNAAASICRGITRRWSKALRNYRENQAFRREMAQVRKLHRNRL